MKKEHISVLDLEKFERGKLHKVWFDVITDPLGQPISIPLLIGRGRHQGPVLGLTAVVHGNELNGIAVIQRLFKDIGDSEISGTLLGIPVVNVPSFIRKKRRFVDGVDLNHIMPGKARGSVSEVYAKEFFDGIVAHFEYILDIHTASSGRVNSHYVRADLDDKVTREMALLQNSQIIVHNPPSDGTLRGAAEELSIPAITLELGNPATFQKSVIKSGISGLHNVLVYLNMIKGDIEPPEEEPVICKRSYWIYTEQGGLLSVFPNVTDTVKKGDVIAIQYDLFGDKLRDYLAPEDGIIIGKSTSPVNQTGGRILHLGIL